MIMLHKKNKQKYSGWNNCWVNWWNNPTQQPLALCSLMPQSALVGCDRLGWKGRHLNFDSFSITWPKTVFFLNRSAKAPLLLWSRLCGNTGRYIDKTARCCRHFSVALWAFIPPGHLRLCTPGCTRSCHVSDPPLRGSRPSTSQLLLYFPHAVCAVWTSYQGQATCP